MMRTADLANDMLHANEDLNGRDTGQADAGERSEPLMESFQPFPIDALPDPVARFVRSVAGATGTDPSWAALAALATIAGCVGNRAAVTLKRGWIEPAILWAAMVGKSGSIKSVVLRLVTRPLVEFFKLQRDAFEKQLREYAAESVRYSAALLRWKTEQRTRPPTDPPVEPMKPSEKRILVSDVTIEKLAALLGENPLGLLVVRDELAGLVNSFDRYARGRGSDLQSWLSMNDAGPLLVDRKSDGSMFVERASVSLLGTIQPFTLKQVFGSVEREAGLLARVLLAYPPDRPALWNETELSDEVVAEWRDLLAALQALVPALDDAGRPRPRLIGLTSDGKKGFISWHDRHAREVGDLADDHLRAHWSKLKGVCARIALLCSCTEAATGASVSSVSSDSIRRAIDVTEWLKTESARVYAGLGGSNGSGDERHLAEWIKRRGEPVTVRDVAHGLWMFRGDTSGARGALEALVKSGIGRWIAPAPCPSGGRPTERFEMICEASPSPEPRLGTP